MKKYTSPHMSYIQTNTEDVMTISFNEQYDNLIESPFGKPGGSGGSGSDVWTKFY